MEVGKPLTTPVTPQPRDGAPVTERGPSPDDVAQWAGLEETDEFKQLTRSRVRFVLPATIFFLVYYFLLPLGNGLAPDFMRTNVIGHINIAYLFALSQFIMAWVLAWLYIRRADNVFDVLAEKVRRRAARGKGAAS